MTILELNHARSIDDDQELITALTPLQNLLIGGPGLHSGMGFQPEQLLWHQILKQPGGCQQAKKLTTVAISPPELLIEERGTRQAAAALGSTAW